MKKIFYDVETTGTNWMKHSIIQLSGLIEIDGETVDKFDFKVRPHIKAKIEQSAMEVNGISELDVWGYPPMTEVHSLLVSKLGQYCNKYDKKDKFWLIGFNNRAFDDYFLRVFFDLCQDRYIGSWFWNNTIDVMVLATQYLLEVRPDMPSFKLKRVAKQMGIKVEEERLHEALYDCYLTKAIYEILTNRHDSLF